MKEVRPRRGRARRRVAPNALDAAFGVGSQWRSGPRLRLRRAGASMDDTVGVCASIRSCFDHSCRQSSPRGTDRTVRFPTHENPRRTARTYTVEMPLVPMLVPEVRLRIWMRTRHAQVLGDQLPQGRIRLGSRVHGDREQAVLRRIPVTAAPVTTATKPRPVHGDHPHRGESQQHADAAKSSSDVLVRSIFNRVSAFALQSGGMRVRAAYSHSIVAGGLLLMS